MFFKKKITKEDMQCAMCNSKINKKYSFCPHCGNSLSNPEDEQREFGLLGRQDAQTDEFAQQSFAAPATFTDKMLGSLMNSLMKNLDRQFRDIEKNNQNNIPRGIQIKIGMSPAMPRKKKYSTRQVQAQITEKQMQKMSTLPRTAAKTSIKRIGDRVIYELNTPGLVSPNDVFVSKLESGYEIKALSDKKIYVNSLPVNLPIHSFAIDNGKLYVEFRTHE